MAANSAQARDIAYQVHPQTNLRLHQTEGPLVVERGDGPYVFDDTGRRYLEGMAGLWCASLGFSERRLAEVAYEQMKTLPYYHTFNGRSHPQSIDLAEKLIENRSREDVEGPLPVRPDRRPTTPPSSSVWYYHNAIGKPKKKKIIGRMKGYHGTTAASVSLSGQGPHARRLRPAPRSASGTPTIPTTTSSRRRGRARRRSRPAWRRVSRT